MFQRPFLSAHFLPVLLLSAKGGRRAANASPTPASVPGVNQPRPASILLPTSQNTPMESAGTGMTGNIQLLLLCFQLKINHSIRYLKYMQYIDFGTFYLTMSKKIKVLSFD